MTPREKAIELVDKYRDRFYLLLTDDAIKDCALIAVDEIIKSNPCIESSDRGGNFEWAGNSYYWQEVKNEIEKL